MIDAVRPVSAVFDDLKQATHRAGAIHAVSYIVYRDSFVAIDDQGTLSTDPEHRYSRSRLNNNEMLLLMGLLIQAEDDKTVYQLPDSNLIDQFGALLEDLHQSISAEIKFSLESSTPELSFGPMAREAIYYGAETAYPGQYRRLARVKYKKDNGWLLEKVGLSIGSIVDIASFIANEVNRKATILLQPDKVNSGAATISTFTDAMLLPKEVLRKKFGTRFDKFMAQFSIGITNQNRGFVSPFELNHANIKPVFDLGDYIYTPSHYRLFESVYESPFYWMAIDQSYVPTSSKHRGDYLESAVEQRLIKIFGRENVHRNVSIRLGKGSKREADVIAMHGNYVLVFEAKSKRLTARAKSGDEGALNDDFRDAVRKPYQQAYDFCELLKQGHACLTECGRALTFDSLTQTIPVVLLSDSFPSIVGISQSLLQIQNGISPIIWDVFVLDCATRIFPHPTDLIAYFVARARYFNRMYSDSEYSIIGYHLAQNLFVKDDNTFLVIEQDFSRAIDDFMFSVDAGLDVSPPRSTFATSNFPVVSRLVEALRKGPTTASSLVVDLMQYSSASQHYLGEQINKVRLEVAQGLSLKSLSIPTISGGFSYVVVQRLDVAARTAAEAIGSKHKYDHKRNLWFVLIDDIRTSSPVDAYLYLREEWQESAEAQQFSDEVGIKLKTRFEERAESPAE